jgi:hypothetical protein
MSTTHLLAIIRRHHQGAFMNRSRKFFPIVVPAVVLAGAGIFGAASASAGGRPLTATLAASNEVGQPGDAGATGSAALALNQGQGEICFDFELVGLTAPASRAHIHRGAAGANGAVVVEFYETGEPALTEGCVAVDGELVKEIRKNPAGFYVNVHNSAAPAGAVRGQLGH